MLDQWFLFLLFVVASGLIATGGFFLMLLFVAITEGKQAAIDTLRREW